MRNLEWKILECNDDFFLFEQELMIEFGTIPEIKKVEESFSEGNEETFEGAIGLVECAEGKSLERFYVKLVLVDEFFRGGG